MLANVGVKLINRLGIKEVMPMVESSKIMGLLIDNNRLCAGAVL